MDEAGDDEEETSGTTLLRPRLPGPRYIAAMRDTSVASSLSGHENSSDRDYSPSVPPSRLSDSQRTFKRPRPRASGLRREVMQASESGLRREVIQVSPESSESSLSSTCSPSSISDNVPSSPSSSTAEPSIELGLQLLEQLGQRPPATSSPPIIRLPDLEWTASPRLSPNRPLPQNWIEFTRVKYTAPTSIARPETDAPRIHRPTLTRLRHATSPRSRHGRNLRPVETNQRLAQTPYSDRFSCIDGRRPASLGLRREVAGRAGTEFKDEDNNQAANTVLSQYLARRTAALCTPPHSPEDVVMQDGHTTLDGASRSRPVSHLSSPARAPQTASARPQTAARSIAPFRTVAAVAIPSTPWNTVNRRPNPTISSATNNITSNATSNVTNNITSNASSNVPSNARPQARPSTLRRPSAPQFSACTRCKHHRSRCDRFIRRGPCSRCVKAACGPCMPQRDDGFGTVIGGDEDDDSD